MAKKIKELQTNVNVRISESQEELWKELAKKEGFSTLSSFVRNCVEKYIEKRKTDKETEIKTKITEIDKKFEFLFEQNKELLKIIAQKTEPIDEKTRDLVYKLIQQKPRDEDEIKNLTSLPELIILEVLAQGIDEKVLELRKDGLFYFIKGE